jgi:hypothetical protein
MQQFMSRKKSLSGRHHSLRRPPDLNIERPLSFTETDCFWPDSAPGQRALAGPEPMVDTLSPKRPLVQNG